MSNNVEKPVQFLICITTSKHQSSMMERGSASQDTPNRCCMTTFNRNDLYSSTQANQHLLILPLLHYKQQLSISSNTLAVDSTLSSIWKIHTVEIEIQRLLLPRAAFRKILMSYWLVFYILHHTFLMQTLWGGLATTISKKMQLPIVQYIGII
jgi:hypothetical protein